MPKILSTKNNKKQRKTTKHTIIPWEKTRKPKSIRLTSNKHTIFKENIILLQSIYLDLLIRYSIQYHIILTITQENTGFQTPTVRERIEEHPGDITFFN